MRIASWNISSGIDMSNYTGELFDKKVEVSIDDKCLKEIAEVIVKNKIDVIALQEVTTTESFKFLERLSELTGLKYYEKFENSPGFLIKDTRIGTAVLSGMPLQVECKKMFRNPNLTKMTKNGLYTTHDKGYLSVKVLAEKPVEIISTQFLPFHRFDADIMEYKSIFDDFQKEVLFKGAVVCGDFNVVEGNKKLKALLSKLSDNYTFAFDCVTTTDDKRCDNILVPSDMEIKDIELVTSTKVSDHYLCLVDINL